MLRTIWTYEWKQWATRRSFLIGVGGLTLLLGYSLYFGRQTADAQLARIEAAMQAEDASFALKKARLDSLQKGLLSPDLPGYQRPDNPLAAGQFYGSGRSAATKPSPLAPLAIGQSDISPILVKATVVSQAEERSLQNPAHQSLGPFDANFVLTFFLPLFVLAFSFNLVSGERESGVLRLMSAQSADFGSLFTARLLFRWGLLSAAVLLALGLGMVMWNIPLVSPATPSLVAGVLLYSLFWFVLALAINFLNKSSSFNAIALLGCWLLLVAVIPQISSALASTLKQVPSRATMVNELRSLEESFGSQRDSLLNSWYQAHPEVVRKTESDMTWEDYWREDFIIAPYTDSLSRAVVARYEEAAREQQAFASNLRMLSPATVLYDLLTTLSGTHPSHAEAFRQGSRAFQQRYGQFFRDKFLNGEPMTLADYDAIPVFTPGNSARAGSTGNLAALVTYCLAAIAAAWLALLIGQVRLWE